MNTCIFHVGLPKTGTSSIQESLFLGSTDRSFRYFSFGEVNGSRGVTTLFGNPDSYFYHRQKGLTERDVKDYRRKWFGRLERALNKAAASGRKVIISAESGWLLNVGQFSAFRRFMEERDHTVKVVAYIRPCKSHIESLIAQRQKTRPGIFDPMKINPRINDYRAIIEMLDRAFGRENVQVYNYNPVDFPDGCVVKDFCERLGIRMNPKNIRRSNDSLSLSAFRLLYTYRNIGPGFGVGLKWLILDWIMLRRLSELRGPALRYHSSLVEPITSRFNEQRPWLRERLGFDLEEDIHRYDSKDCIREESDFFRYDKASLEWLAYATGSSPAADPAEVARQMHILRTRPAFRNVMDFAMEATEKAIGRFRNRV